MSDIPYFPPLHGNVDCSKCEIRTNCMCFGKHQRNRRDFTYTSGRCPRLPDKEGFVWDSEQKLYAATFPLVHAERATDKLHLTLTIPGKRNHKVYRTRSGYWFYREKDSNYGYVLRKVIGIEEYNSEQDILNYMEDVHADYCIFRCDFWGYTV